MKICVITLATGKYVRFLEKFLNSINYYFLNGHDISYLVFTDHDIKASGNIRTIKIDHELWPNIALKKYYYITSMKEYISSFDYSYLFDVDVYLVDKINEEVLQELVGVLHPYKIFEQKSLHPYEKRKESTAYVSDEQKDKYYAGAFVGGKVECFLKMAEKISDCVAVDKENNITAIWHDESHLNKYFSESIPTNLSPSYMFPEELINYPGYPWQPKIVAVNKDFIDTSFNQEKIKLKQYGNI